MKTKNTLLKIKDKLLQIKDAFLEIQEDIFVEISLKILSVCILQLISLACVSICDSANFAYNIELEILFLCVILVSNVGGIFIIVYKWINRNTEKENREERFIYKLGKMNIKEIDELIKYYNEIHMEIKEILEAARTLRNNFIKNPKELMEHIKIYKEIYSRFIKISGEQLNQEVIEESVFISGILKDNLIILNIVYNRMIFGKDCDKEIDYIIEEIIDIYITLKKFENLINEDVVDLSFNKYMRSQNK